ncbi:hypothetical protein V8C86DRAFT_2580690 [Haematococcus lacustris]
MVLLADAVVGGGEADPGPLLPASWVEVQAEVQGQGEGERAAVDLSGLWEKDNARSQVQEYEAMLQLLGLGGLQRMTARLIDGLDISQTPEGFSVAFVTVVPFFRVKEVTPWGQRVQLSRRDLRRGKQWAQAEPVAGGVRVEHLWGEPRPGQLTEAYTLTTSPQARAAGFDEMTVASSLTVGDKKAAVVQVYRRSGKTRDELLRESRQRNTSLDAVLQRQKQEYGS